MQTEYISFPIKYSELDIERFVLRFHFEKKDEELLTAAGRFVAECIMVESALYYEEERVSCVVTLGERFDQLLDAASENLLMAYMMECLGMELLSTSYDKLSEYVFSKQGKWLGEYHFLDEKETERFVLEWEDSDKLPVNWKGGMLHPLKSVIYTAVYKEEKEEGSCSSCEQCTNVSCTFRNTGQIYSYGISQIYNHHSTMSEKGKKNEKQ